MIKMKARLPHEFIRTLKQYNLFDVLKSISEYSSELFCQKESELTAAKFETLTEFVYDQFSITFGNRIMAQIEKLVPAYVACGGKKEEALDFIFARKVLSKVDGRFEEYVKGALKQLLALIHKTYGAGVFKRSERAITQLIKKL